MRLLRQPELARLTGTRDPREQRRVLEESQVAFREQEDGRLIVREDALAGASPYMSIPIDVVRMLIMAHEIRPREGVYFLVDNSEVVYVGTAANVLTRMGGHAKKSFDCARMISVPAPDRFRVERILIGAFNPKYNIAMYDAEPLGPNWDALRT